MVVWQRVMGMVRVMCGGLAACHMYGLSTVLWCAACYWYGVCTVWCCISVL